VAAESHNRALPWCYPDPQDCVVGIYKPFILLASRRGLEPLTPGLGNLCSIQLSYRDSDRRCGSQTAYRQGKAKRGMPLA
jgi:hypothetical protein